MSKTMLKLFFLLLVLVLPACATIPNGPGVFVVPAPGKPFELFRQEDAACRRWAEQQIGVATQDVIDNNTATGAVAGTALGAGLGALLGSASGHAGAGAIIGAAGGMLVGTAAGADSGRVYGRQTQRRYDIAYLQCMYAYDNHAPEQGRMIRRSYRTRASAPPPFSELPPAYGPIPPPPPGARPQTPPEMLDIPEASK